MMRATAAAAAALVLAGCASFSPDGGMGQVSELTQQRTGQPVALQRTAEQARGAQQRVAQILQQPLTPDAAVELALLNNRGLQAKLHGLGIAESDLVQAGRPANPLFSFGRMSGNGTVEIDRAVVFNVLSLLTLPKALEVQQRNFAQAQLQAAYDAVGTAAQARRAYFGAVAAQELVHYLGQVREAAEVASLLSQRMVRAGNLSKLAQMREHAFYADATAGLARAQQQLLVERERLARVLGLAGAQLDFRLADRLPELPPAPAQALDAQRTALDQRLDVQMARRSTEATASALGLTHATRFIDALELGYNNKSESGSPRSNGFELALEVPLFDFGAARTRRAEAVYMQAVQQTAQVAIQAQSEVREAYGSYRTAFDLARHYRDEVLPLRKRISEENLLRYNGMLISVFELLADSREQVSGVTDYVQALRDFWIAETDLQTAITGRSPGDAAAAGPAQEVTAQAAAGH